MTVELFSDGSSLRNPGASGLGYVIRYYEENGEDGMPKPVTIEGNQGFRLSTNNRMEIFAAIYGLNKIIELINNETLKDVSQINVTSDSEYLVKCIKQNWIAKWQTNNWMTSSFGGKESKPVKNKDLWEKMIEVQNILKSMGVNTTFAWTEGHAGNELNEVADRLAVAASSGSEFIKDEVYENLVSSH